MTGIGHDHLSYDVMDDSTSSSRVWHTIIDSNETFRWICSSLLCWNPEYTLIPSQQMLEFVFPFTRQNDWHVFAMFFSCSGIDLAGQTLSNTFIEVPMGWIWMITLIKSHSPATAPTLTLQWAQAAWQPMVNYTTPDMVCLSLKGLFNSLCLALVRWCG